MMPLILATAGDEARARAIAAGCEGEVGVVASRAFPDGELYLRIDTACAGRAVWVVSSLHPVRDKLLAAYFLAATARELGAASVGLCAPYLAYLRQDARFAGGEAVTSRYVARMLTTAIDRLVAVDPHLHRYGSLDEVYPVPSRVVAAAPRIAAWLGKIERPIVVGPDAESQQWVEAVARARGCPHVVLAKTRRGDRDVSISPVPTDIDWAGATPVVVDDIISTGRTMIGAVEELVRAGALAPICVGVHAAFSDDAEAALRAAGASEIATCNTIAHPTNAIDVLDLVGRAMLDPW